ncbi:19532_t:CDS:2, partial [Gigaspora rosea]
MRKFRSSLPGRKVLVKLKNQDPEKRKKIFLHLSESSESRYKVSISKSRSPVYSTVPSRYFRENEELINTLRKIKLLCQTETPPSPTPEQIHHTLQVSFEITKKATNNHHAVFETGITRNNNDT